MNGHQWTRILNGPFIVFQDPFQPIVTSTAIFVVD